MKHLFYIVPFFMLLACDEVSFKEPQPKGKKSLVTVPVSIQGKYILQENGKEPSNDTIIIEPSGFRFGYFNPSERDESETDDEGRLGDSLVLKQFKGYYFWSMNENPEWKLRVIRKEKNGNLTLLEPGKANVEFQDYVKQLNQVIKVDTLRYKGEKLYQIDPTAKELIKLIKKGYFTETTLLKVR